MSQGWSEVLQVKAAVRARDGFRCQKCGITNDDHLKLTDRSLDVHRVTPGSEYSAAPGVCVTLCRSCHGPEPKSPRKPNQRLFPKKEMVALSFKLSCAEAEAIDAIADRLAADSHSLRPSRSAALRYLVSLDQ